MRESKEKVFFVTEKVRSSTPCFILFLYFMSTITFQNPDVEIDCFVSAHLFVTCQVGRVIHTVYM